MSYSGPLLWGPQAHVGEGPGVVLVEARSCTGRVTADTAGIADCNGEAGETEGGGCEECVGTPVHTMTGEMSYLETQPIAGFDWLPFRLSYSSGQHATPGLFGNGWHSILSSRFTEYTGLAGTHYVGIYTERGIQYVFSGDGTIYTQIYPKTGRRSHLTRSQDAYTHTDSDGRMSRRFVGGVLNAYTDTIAGRSLFISWSNGVPTQVDDSWGTASATITTDASTGFITAITPESDPSLSWTYTYSGTHLTTSSSPEGAWRSYEYWSDYFGRLQQLTTVRDGSGRIIERHNYGSNRTATTSEQQNDDITAISTDLPGRTADERLSTITYRTGRVTKHYRRFVAGKWRVVEIVDGCSSCGANSRLVAFDGAGNVARTQDADGYVTSRTFDHLHRVTSERTARRPAGCDPATAPDRCWQSPESIGLVELADTPASATTTYVYGDPTWVHRPTLVTTESIRQSGGSRTESLTYHPASGEVLQRVVTGWTGTPPIQETHTTSTTTYDGVEASAFEPGGAFAASWAPLAQPPGRPKTTDGARSDVADVTSYVYYPIAEVVPKHWRGRLAAVRNALGHVTRYEDYDAFGNARRTIDPNGVAVLSTFDRLGRRTATTLAPLISCDTTSDPLCGTALTSSVSYDGAGPVVTQTSASGGVTTFTYDDRGRVATVARGVATADLRERSRFTYDPATGRKSRETAERFENGTWVETRHVDYTYDASSQLSSTIAADGSRITYTYDADGQLASAQDENHDSANTFYSYDSGGRLTRVHQVLASSSGGGIDTFYSYDRHGNLTSVTDANGNITSYQYDDFGRMLSQTSPVTGVTTYSYDQPGNLLSTTDANGASINRSFDALGRVESQTSSRGLDTETNTWTYDEGPFGVGRLAGTADTTGSTTYRYDRRGLVLHEEKTIDGTPYSTRHTYDIEGQPSTLTYPSGMVVAYSYDFAGRPVSASVNGTALVTNTTYLPFGPPEEITYGNGTRRVTTHDMRYRISSHRLVRGVADIASYGYEYDLAGNITSIQDLLDPRYDRAFEYDDLNRLVGTNTGTKLWGAGAYQYDAMGNLLSSAAGVDQRSFSYLGSKPQLDVLTEFGASKNITYDLVGSEVAVGSEAYTYNPRNQLVGAPDVDYVYDARGVRTITRTTVPTHGLQLALSPVAVRGGEPTTITVQTDAAAPTGGLRVALSSTDRNVIVTPDALVIPSGQTSASTTIHTLPQYEDTSVTLVATRLTNRTTATASVSASPKIASFTIAGPVVGGNMVEATILLNSSAVASGETVHVSSSSPAATPPVTVTIPAGATALTFSITTTAVSADEEVAIRATLRGTAEQSLLIVGPAAVSSVSISPTDIGPNQVAVGRVVLAHAAPAGGIVVTLQSNSAAASVPPTVLVPAGQRTADFNVTANEAEATTTATITATHATSASGSITVWTQAFLSDLAIQPRSVVGSRMTATGTVTLSAPAPAGGSVVTLASSDPIATVPGTLLIAEGATVGTFAVTSAAAAAATAVRVSGVYGATQTADIEVGSCSSWIADSIAPAESETMWFDDALPAGAAQAGTWTSDTRQYTSGLQSHSEPAAGGLHQHYFTGGSALAVTNAGDELFAYVLLDPCNPPRQVILQWNDGNWEHRAYWGENLIGWGTDATSGRRFMGPLPELGRWTRLAVPASQVGLASRNVTGMAFTLYDGKAWFDRAGLVACESATVEPAVVSMDETLWLDDDLPGSASATNWQWDTSLAASGTRSHTSPLVAGTHQNSFQGATSEPLLLTSGSSIFTYVLLDTCNPPRELMLEWYDGNWEHRAYWGENLIARGSLPTGRNHMGQLPAAGEWVRLEVPAMSVGLAGRSVTGASFVSHDGKAWFDRVGTIPCTTAPAPAPPLPATDIVWFDDAPPAGATTFQAWQWDAAEKVSGTHSFRDARNEYAHSFWFTTTMPLTVSSDDTIFTWVRLDPCDPPQEILLEFFDGSGWEHRAFWGSANLLQGGAPNTAAHRRMGPMPPAGEWVRLEIPASLVGVSNVFGMRFVLSNGNAWWDRVGHAPSQQALAASGEHLTRADAGPRGRRRGWWARLLPVGTSDEVPINMSLGASYVSDSSTERRYSIYSPALQLLAETATTSASAPSIAHEYIWFGGEPLAQIETATGAVHYYFNDHLGAPVLTTDASGAVDWRVEREPYGAVYSVRAGAERHQPLALPGQEDGGELSYNIFRWYRAGWGRYTQSDPIGVGGAGIYAPSVGPRLFTIAEALLDEQRSLFSLSGRVPARLYTFPHLLKDDPHRLDIGTNGYAYVSGNPVNREDPLGLLNEDNIKPQFGKPYCDFGVCTPKVCAPKPCESMYQCMKKCVGNTTPPWPIWTGWGMAGGWISVLGKTNAAYSGGVLYTCTVHCAATGCYPDDWLAPW